MISKLISTRMLRGLTRNKSCLVDKQFEAFKTPHIGLLGGSGPDAGIQLMQQILKVNKDYQNALQLPNKTQKFHKVCPSDTRYVLSDECGYGYQSDKDAPRVTLFNSPLMGGPHGTWDLEKGSVQRDLILNEIRQNMTQFKLVGVENFAIACNTLHVLSSDIRSFAKELNLQSEEDTAIAELNFVSIIEAVYDKIVRLPLQRTKDQKIPVCILGTLMTMDLGFQWNAETNSLECVGNGASPYSELNSMISSDDFGIKLLPVADIVQQETQQLITEFKGARSQCFIDDELKPRAIQLVKNIRDYVSDELGVRGDFVIILGCTELPCLLMQEDFQIVDENGNTMDFPTLLDPNIALSERLLGIEKLD